MEDLATRLRKIHDSDHMRGCMGRQYSCTCGYDDQKDALVAEAAAALAVAPAQGAVEWSDDDYKRARDCMRSILQDDYRHGRNPLLDLNFDNAFQHAVGILAITAARTPAGGGDPELMIVGDNDSAGVVPYSANEALAEIDRLREELSQARALVEELTANCEQYRGDLDAMAQHANRLSEKYRGALERIRNFPYVGTRAAQEMAAIAADGLSFSSTMREDK